MAFANEVECNRLEDANGHHRDDEGERKRADDHRDPDCIDASKDEHAAHDEGERRSSENDMMPALAIGFASAVDRVHDQDCAVGRRHEVGHQQDYHDVRHDSRD